MTAIDQAIKDAVENGGWKPRRGYRAANWAVVTSKRDFWIALGKARGWDDGEHEDETYVYAPVDMEMWKWKWHRFIDRLAEGKDAESFFQNIT
jgi:hypothetical protein